MTGAPLQNPFQPLSQNGGIGNYTAITDPGATNDLTQGYVAGSFWVNTANGRVWMCVSNAAGAATWALDGVIPGVGVEPSSMITYFGGGTNTFPEEGNVYRNVIWPGTSPAAASASQYVLDVLALSAGSFDRALRGLQITSAGSFAANTDSKTIQLVVSNTAQVAGAVSTGATVIATTGSVATNGGGWEISANFFKYGAAGSNTQVAIHSQAQVGSGISALQAPIQTTLNESAIIYFALTASCPTAVADVVENWFEINAMN